MKKQTLNLLKPGTRAKVLGFINHDPAYRQKLLAMGLTPGVEFQVIRLAPLGDPLQINVRGFNLSIRKSEANVILVEEAE